MLQRANTSAYRQLFGGIGLRSLDDILAVINGDIDIPTAGACQKRLAKHGTEALRDLYNQYAMAQSIIGYGKAPRTLQHFIRGYMRKVRGKELKRKTLVEAIYRQEGSIVLCILYLT